MAMEKVCVPGTWWILRDVVDVALLEIACPVKVIPLAEVAAV